MKYTGKGAGGGRGGERGMQNEHTSDLKEMSLAFPGKPVTTFMHISKSKTETLNPLSFVDGIYSQVCKNICCQNATNESYWK